MIASLHILPKSLFT